LVDEQSRVWIGADSATSWDNDEARVQITRNPKVFRAGCLLIGSSGSGRVQVLLRTFVPPKRPKGSSAFDYIATTVAEGIRKMLSDAGAVALPNDSKPMTMPYNSTILIGYKGGLYRMDDDFSVDEAADEIDVAGSGGSWALPVLSLTRGKPPKERILAALKASARQCWSVRAPYRVDFI
jgi:hypothetical protein